MTLRLHNTLSGEKEEFSPLHPPHVGFYSCGPTVYNYPHIGNYRAYIFADTLKRVLTHNGYAVKHIMNITDVDDKTIRDSQKEGKTLKDFTELYTSAFLKEIAELNIIPANAYPRASEYIDEMVRITEQLLEKGHAYRSDDGSTYYKIDTFKDYGALVGLKQDTLKENAGGRIKNDEYDKENPSDFALWKAWDANDGDVFWETRLGKGRPGWHIECSAMSMKNLGESFDIHTGGIDNIFPHHDNEIAQSEGSTGHQFVRYWLHNGWILVDGKKMAKSMGNFYTLDDLKDRGFAPLAYRYLVLSAHYRSPLNFTWESLEAAQEALMRLYRTFRTLPDEHAAPDDTYLARFKGFVNDDLNTPQALALMWELVKDEHITPAVKRATLVAFDEIFALGLGALSPIVIPEEIELLVQQREAARQSGTWEDADALRLEIERRGYGINDTPEGPEVFPQ